MAKAFPVHVIEGGCNLDTHQLNLVRLLARDILRCDYRLYHLMMMIVRFNVDTSYLATLN